VVQTNSATLRNYLAPPEVNALYESAPIGLAFFDREYRYVRINGELAEINGVPAPTHIAARLFTDEGFASTAMGLQARTERLRPHGFAPAGIDIAESADGGTMMADHDNRTSSPPRNEDADMERERVRSSNDRNPAPEREGIESERRRSSDDAAKGMGDDIDPDSAESENDRDDMITE